MRLQAAATVPRSSIETLGWIARALGITAPLTEVRIPGGSLIAFAADLPAVQSVTISFDSWIPSKKNHLRPRKGPGKGKMYDPEVKQAMTDLRWQAKAQWAHRLPVRHPILHFWIAAPDKQDRDGIVTTLLDVLKAEEILVDDSIRWNNGLCVIYPAAPSDQKASAVCRIDVVEAPCETTNAKAAGSPIRR